MKLTLHSHLSAKETPSMLHPLYFFAVIFLFVLLLSAPGNLQAQRSLHGTSTPGELFFELNPNNPDYTSKFLQHSTDYGATFETPALWEGDTVAVVLYDRGLDLLITFGWDSTGQYDSCYTFSYDKGQTQVDGPAIVHPSARVGPVSTEFFHGSAWSKYTLRHWQEGDGNNGWWPKVTASKHIAGWSPGEAWGLSWENSSYGDDSTATLWHYTDYDDHITAFRDSLFFIKDGVLVRGYAPGEIYFLKGYRDYEEGIDRFRVYVTTDTGRTWSEHGPIPVNTLLGVQYEFIHGWQPGELIALFENYYYSWDLRYDILYTQDYGETWTFTQGEPYVSSVDDPVYQITLPTRPTLTAWPNPTNSRVTFNTTFQRPARVLLYTITGQEVWRGTLQPGNQGTIPLDDYPSGTYLLTLPDAGITQRITLMK